MKTLLRILSVITTGLLIVPLWFFIYQALFPLFYFFGLAFFFKKDDDAFFYGYWITMLVLTIFLSKFMFRLFNKWRPTAVILSCISPTIFAMFAIKVFPYYGRFPDVTIINLINRGKRNVAYALTHASNNHPAPPFYESDKTRIEHALKKYNERFYNAIKLKSLQILSSRRDTLAEIPDSLNYGLYNLFISTSDDLITNISVDTILYDRSFKMLFVTVVYRSNVNEYGGKVFIGDRQSDNNNLIKLYPYEYILFPDDSSKDAIVLSMRESHFTHSSREIGPLDSNFWKSPLFTKNATVDTAGLPRPNSADQTLRYPFLIIR